MKHIYKVAEHTFEINVDAECGSWQQLKSHYDPFCTDDTHPALIIDVECGDVMAQDHAAMSLIHHEDTRDDGFLAMDIYADADNYLFILTQSQQEHPNVSLKIDRQFSHGKVTIGDTPGETPTWQNVTSLTAAIQLAYMLATTSSATILTHSSAVLKDGKAYLFLGKSGTGKSTHSRLWLKNVAGATLLNDDHPIIRVHDGTTVMAYGSPWSGKTHCYKNLQAPVGGIIRIKRALYNAIVPQGPLQAYASLITSFSGMTIDKAHADQRHQTIERIVATTPCYELSCLPDDDAAMVCSGAVIR